MGRKKLVSSKIEITKSTTTVTNKNVKEKDGGVGDGGGLIQYRMDILTIRKAIVKHAIGLSPNLLSVKMGLMASVREVERMMKENKRG